MINTCPACNAALQPPVKPVTGLQAFNWNTVYKVSCDACGVFWISQNVQKNVPAPNIANALAKCKGYCFGSQKPYLHWTSGTPGVGAHDVGYECYPRIVHQDFFDALTAALNSGSISFMLEVIETGAGLSVESWDVPRLTNADGDNAGHIAIRVLSQTPSDLATVLASLSRNSTGTKEVNFQWQSSGQSAVSGVNNKKRKTWRNELDSASQISQGQIKLDLINLSSGY